MTPKDPFLEGTFWDKFWRPIRSRALLFTPESQVKRDVAGNSFRHAPFPNAVRKRRFKPKFLGVFLFCSGGK